MFEVFSLALGGRVLTGMDALGPNGVESSRESVPYARRVPGSRLRKRVAARNKGRSR
jgi:hypothetical protein